MATFPELEPSLVETAIGEVDEPTATTTEENSLSKPATAATDVKRTAKPVQRSMSDRYSYRAAIYKNDADLDLT